MAIPPRPRNFHYKSGTFSGLPPIVFGVLTGMDNQGEMILGTWLYGGGVDHHVRDDPLWSDYMKAHRILAGQVLVNLRPAVQKIADMKKVGRFPTSERFHAEFPENRGFSGYALLHGSNQKVGDFVITGFAEVQEAIDPAEGDYDIELDLTFVFNDIVDPNPNYWTDTVKSAIASLGTDPRSYRLSIGWRSSCLAEVRKGRDIVFSGYPSAHPRVVRPLPRAKLDWAGAERKRAQEIEAKIIAQLKRDISATDTSSQADRKRRLLWLFYRLSGYMGITYISRLSRAASNDELVRLLQRRISRELRAEITQALRGKRPQGAEPI